MKAIQLSLHQAISIICLTTTAILAQESKEELITKLRGTAGAVSGSAEASGGLKARSLTTRSLSSIAAPVQPTETRSVIFSPRGIPKAIEAAAEENRIEKAETTASKSTGAG